MEKTMAVRVLVVDDNQMVLAVLERLLRTALGYEVDTVRNGRDAIDAIRSHGDRFGVVLLDDSTPGMDTEDIVSAIHRAAPDLAVLLMSEDEPQLTRARLAACEIAGFLAKPFNRGELEDALRRITNVPRLEQPNP